MAAILDAILNFKVTVACSNGCPPRNCCRRSKESNHIIITTFYSRPCLFSHKIGWFAPWVSLTGRVSDVVRLEGVVRGRRRELRCTNATTHFRQLIEIRAGCTTTHIQRGLPTELALFHPPPGKNRNYCKNIGLLDTARDFSDVASVTFLALQLRNTSVT